MVVGETKLDSKLMQLKIVADQTEILNQTGFATYAIRPQDSFPFEESSFQSGESPSSSNIENAESFNRP